MGINHETYRLTFGKYIGHCFSEIPRSYVAWLSRECHQPLIKQFAVKWLKAHPGGIVFIEGDPRGDYDDEEDFSQTWGESPNAYDYQMD